MSLVVKFILCGYGLLKLQACYHLRQTIMDALVTYQKKQKMDALVIIRKVLHGYYSVVRFLLLFFFFLVQFFCFFVYLLSDILTDLYLIIHF